MNPSDLPQIPQDRDGPVFNVPWEAQAFAMAVKLNEAGHFTWTEWAGMLGAEIAAHPQARYYENWLAALEKLAEKKGLMTQVERQHRVAEWDRAAKATPHGRPIELSRS
ncbi:MAG: nitrile hydratase accessory protein [Hyphomicrobiales bacterium]